MKNMSWSVNYIGSPGNISAALEKQSGTLSGQSKQEFDAALPHLIALINQNQNKNAEPALRLAASGHASESYSSCSVAIEYLSGTLV